jgi:hypothetical protein
MPFVGNAGRFTHIYLAEVNQDNTRSTTSTPPTSINYNFNEITIGKDAGKTSQGINAIALGSESGNTSQGEKSVAVGYHAGRLQQGVHSQSPLVKSVVRWVKTHNLLLLGYRSGQSIQGSQSVAVGC